MKDPLHLLTKIVRKRKKAIEEGKESPYLDISVDNYKNIINDLVGIRAIYLFKENWSWVNSFILSDFSVCADEKIIIYHAADDDLSFYLKRENMNNKYKYEYDLSEKESRYRSTHYIIKGITPHSFNFELQTRTILDEAWGEIDHHIRYPNFEHHTELNRKMSVLNGAISGCEELTSNFFNYFNTLRVETDEEMTSQLSGEDDTLIESVVKDVIEEGFKISDETWDKIISNAALSREKLRTLRSKNIINHTRVTGHRDTSDMAYLDNLLLRTTKLNSKADSNSKVSKEQKSSEPRTRVSKYRDIVESVVKELPLKKDED